MRVLREVCCAGFVLSIKTAHTGKLIDEEEVERKLN
jgi:hypothetical protein